MSADGASLGPEPFRAPGCLELATILLLACGGGDASRPRAPTTSVPSLDVMLLADPSVATACYCTDALVTSDVTHPLLLWGSQPPAPPPHLSAHELVFVAAIAPERCAIPGGVGVPTFVRAARSGPDVIVDLTWQGRPDARYGGLIPDPFPGGRVRVRLHDSWTGGSPALVEECTVGASR